MSAWSIRLPERSPPGTLFCEIPLRDGRVLLLSADDLQNYCLSWDVPKDHYETNCVQAGFRLSDFRDFFVMKRFFDDNGPHAPDQEVVGALQAPAEGRSPAVDLTQEAHVGLAVQAGTLGDDTRMEYRSPLLRGPFRPGIVIDNGIDTLSVRFSELPLFWPPDGFKGLPGLEGNQK